ncbi:hypothetical protein EUGRSUZ_I00297 [Eucalyptus grandis]|uniref:Uncharacterized protein n=2 Tax=Eucalyptus grandis TaxID=71139 RepID=A0ACC3JBB5_EUCGR|nr:hypothetical protein EUGRSUZ_I00297 [Eucalyptus grandis]
MFSVLLRIGILSMTLAREYAEWRIFVVPCLIVCWLMVNQIARVSIVQANPFRIWLERPRWLLVLDSVSV